MNKIYIMYEPACICTYSILHWHCIRKLNMWGILIIRLLFLQRSSVIFPGLWMPSAVTDYLCNNGPEPPYIIPADWSQQNQQVYSWLTWKSVGLLLMCVWQSWYPSCGFIMRRRWVWWYSQWQMPSHTVSPVCLSSSVQLDMFC